MTEREKWGGVGPRNDFGFQLNPGPWVDGMDGIATVPPMSVFLMFIL